MTLDLPTTRAILPSGGVWLIPLGWRPTSEDPEPCPFCGTPVLWTETARSHNPNLATERMLIEQDGTMHRCGGRSA